LLGAHSSKFAALTPEESVERALAYGAQIHPQYPAEFETGISLAWHRVPSTLGCFSVWPDETRAQHHKNLYAIDGRILLAGEHASYLNAWQEGAALEAITRLHHP
jgi:monoamine oxidase